MSRPVLAVGGASLMSLVALWLVPPIGFVAVMILLVLIPPWGRSLSERAVISAMVVIGMVAVAFPRAGATPVTTTSARVALTVVVIFALALRLVPALREIRIPRPTIADVFVLVLAAASSAWLMAAYVGRSSVELVSGLFFSGWDNQGHFTTFANTYEIGSTTWPTMDGSVAWNQWYPSLHTTMWSLADLASRGGSQVLDRTALLWPYVQWSAISFGLCIAGLAWVAGDLADRIARSSDWIRARPVAVALVAIFGLLGSPAFLFNKGFTNFMMGVTVGVIVSYVSARSWRSARVLGWFLIPLGALTIIGLWTPLVLGLVPSGVVVAISLLRYRRVLGLAWLAGTAILGVVMVLTQSQAILGVEPGQSTADFTTSLGAVGSGMASFNVGAALAAPVIVALLATLLVRRHRWPMPAAILGPVLGAGVVAIVFAAAADSADVPRLLSYYVLKCLNAMLLAAAPVIAALVAVAAVRALRGVGRVNAMMTIALGAVVAVAMFGYVGALPASTGANFIAAPGIQAGADRTQGVNDPLIGEAIVRGAAAAAPYPDFTTLLWDGAGTLPNLWMSSLAGVMSKSQNAFYRGLPSFPYDSRTAEYVGFALNLDARLRVVVLWFRDPSGDLLELYAQGRGDDRVKLVRVPMPSNLLCPECSL